jgi:pilus assembly protein Flp/PilA
MIEEPYAGKKGGEFMIEIVNRLARDDRGATLVEYGLLLALVALAAVVAMGTLGGQVSALFTNASNDL